MLKWGLLMGFIKEKYSLKSYQSRSSEFVKANRKVVLALPTGSGKSLASTFSIYDIFAKEDYRVLFITEKVAIDDIQECMNTFFKKGTYKPCDTVGYNFSSREIIYSDFITGDYNAIVTTYAIMRNDKDYLLTLINHLKSRGIKLALVLDEATQVKSEDSLNHKVAKVLGKRCDVVIALTATPISSKLNDIDNIIRCVGSESYLSKERFKNRFEINTFETEGFLFKIKGSSVYINSENDSLPERVLKKGVPYFKIPWKIDKKIFPESITIHTKRSQTHKVNGLSIYLPSLRVNDGDYSLDITPFLSWDKSKHSFTLYVPLVRNLRESLVRFHSIGFTLNSTDTRKNTVESNHTVIFSYEIGGNLIGYKNISEYKEITKNVLFTLNKSEVGDIPPTVLLKRQYKTDSMTKKAVQKVYETAKGATTSVARIMIASTAVSHILEDNKLYINSKVKLLLEDLASEISNDPVIIFSPLVTVVEYLSKVLENKNIDHCTYHGQLSNEAKTKNKNDFKSGRKKIIIISSAAAKGVNLQIARTMIFFDLPYTAENFMQVSGRISRLGSLHNSLNVIAYRSESEDAIENCLYRSIMGQMNFIRKVSLDLVDDSLVDKGVTDLIDPEDADKYILSRLGHSKHYYCN